MVSTSILFLHLVQGPEALNASHFYRGAAEPSKYLARFIKLASPWDKQTKLLFVERLFEASKTIDEWERKKLPGDLGGREIVESDQDFKKLAQNFPTLRGGTSEITQVRTLTAKLRSTYEPEYQRSKPFHSSATYRKSYPSPVHFLAYYESTHPHISKKWLESELKFGATWESKNPNLDNRLVRDSGLVTRYRLVFPHAKPKDDLLGYSISTLYRAAKTK